MKNYEEDIYLKSAPTDNDLQVIEEGNDEIIKDVNTPLKGSVNGDEVVQGVNGKVTLTKLELEMIDEMVRIIEDPNYISAVRARRLGTDDEIVDSELSEISFDENSGISNEDMMAEYRELHF